MGVQKSKKSTRFTKFSIKKILYKNTTNKDITIHRLKDLNSNKNIFYVSNKHNKKSNFFGNFTKTTHH